MITLDKRDLELLQQADRLSLSRGVFAAPGDNSPETSRRIARLRAGGLISLQAPPPRVPPTRRLQLTEKGREALKAQP